MNPDGSGSRLLVPGGGIDLAWKPDGSAITYTALDHSGQLRTVDLATGKIRPVIDLPGSEGDAAWSPDGSKIAFSWFAPRGGGLYVVDANGSHLHRVGDVPYEYGRISWSPGGEWLAFGGNDGKSGEEIYVVRSDGTGLRRVTDTRGSKDPSWGLIAP